MSYHLIDSKTGEVIELNYTKSHELVGYFLDRVTKKNNSCWEWDLVSDSNGYGSASVRKFNFTDRTKFEAHRLSYLLFNGDLKDGYEICHKCDNRICVNPNHLFQGTHSDNMQDCHDKGRHPGANLSGCDNPQAKLKRDEIIQIYEMYHDKSDKTQTELAKQFDVSPTTIYDIVNEDRWEQVLKESKLYNLKEENGMVEHPEYGELLEVKEFSKKVDVTEQTIRSYLSGKGEAPNRTKTLQDNSVKYAGRRLIQKQALEEW